MWNGATDVEWGYGCGVGLRMWSGAAAEEGVRSQDALSLRVPRSGPTVLGPYSFLSCYFSGTGE